MKIPHISEECLEAVKAVLIRDLKSKDPYEELTRRIGELLEDNPNVWEWLRNTVESMEGCALIFPEVRMDDGTEIDDRVFVPLRLAQNMLLVTGIQLYKVIKVKLESDELRESVTD
jgi:hypothetical protein